MAEIQAALNNRNISSSESPFLNEVTEKDSSNLAVVTGDDILATTNPSSFGSLHLVQPASQPNLQQERINSSPGLAQIPDVDDDEKDDAEAPPPPPPPPFPQENVLSPTTTLWSSPLAAGPLDSSNTSIDSLTGGPSRRSSITSKYERSQTHGLSMEEVTRQKEALLAFYTEHAPKRATAERVEENFELFGPRIWHELKMKYGEEKVFGYEPKNPVEDN